MRVWEMRNGISFTVSTGDHQRLRAIVAVPKSPQKHVWRARIVLLSGEDIDFARQRIRVRAHRGIAVGFGDTWFADFESIGMKLHAVAFLVLQRAGRLPVTVIA